MQAQSRPSLPELTTRSRGQVIDTVRASATKVALMRRRVMSIITGLLKKRQQKTKQNKTKKKQKQKKNQKNIL